MGLTVAERWVSCLALTAQHVQAVSSVQWANIKFLKLSCSVCTNLCDRVCRMLCSAHWKVKFAGLSGY
jgi:hypothetical protein